MGILCDDDIVNLFAAGDCKIDSSQLQPASLDLRLGSVAWRVRASFLAGTDSTVQEKLTRFRLHEIDITDSAVLETNCVYIVPLQEFLSLPSDMSASTNPKSSTGRLDIFTRVITDHGERFDTIPAGYCGPLYLEISPRTFPIVVREGSRLAQIRFRRGDCRVSDDELRVLHKQEKLVAGDDLCLHDGSVALSIDLSGTDNSDGLIGYRAKRHSGVIDVDNVAGYCSRDFWEPIHHHGSGDIVLDPNEFYILVSREAVHIPPTMAAEMVAFDPLVGEFRVHYAGFFDPGFGHGRASKAVLEVRSHEVPFIVEHGQIVARLVYERMLSTPRHLYGVDLSSNYQGQGLKLSKHFV